ncbi:hypothetical protein FP2506_15509 [Fulvimarina pelagi HTCC2506]|uniref:VCBS repeat-containing protein n=1 Tax=Fulvimarina pelagi HTCC2506 TaxID=314231 RepID=Q0G3H8_9HYPH|nr:hypothetical protein [Fulvimarina pelagi]EAU41853.1 hypothetical protein FP2506_15509 [Fulvimarina pelagi HTCC2506]
MLFPFARLLWIASAYAAISSLPFPAVAQGSAAGAFAPEDIVAVATGDFDGNGTMDAAMIVLPLDEDATDSDLYVFLEGAGEDTPPGKLALALHRKAAAWGAGPLMAGQVPQLTALENGSLRIETENTGIGRNAWQQKVTLAYRDGRFRVAGFTYEAYDKLQEEDPLSCDLNLFAGTGELNGEPVGFKATRTPFEDWTEDDAFRICGIG